MSSADVDITEEAAGPAVPRRSMEEWLFHEDGILTKDEALEVVAKAKAFTGQLHRILHRAHERRIWVPLGYASWAEFAGAEFDVSRSRSYQMLDLAKVQAALGTGDDPDAPPALDWDAEHLTEAQARPLARFKGDRRAIRLIWARAREIAGPNDPSTQTQVQQAVDEWLAPVAGDEWMAESRLAPGVVWTSGGPGSAWWHWVTCDRGVVLFVGIGTFPGPVDIDKASNTWFVSAPRYGDLTAVARNDADTLLPRVLAELFGNQVPAFEEVDALARVELSAGRGPFHIRRDRLEQAFTELAHIYDDDYSWSDTSSHEPVDPDDEVVDAEIIDDDDPHPAPGQAPPSPGPAATSPAPPVSGDVPAGDDGSAPEPSSSATPQPRRVTVDELDAYTPAELIDAVTLAMEVGHNARATSADVRYAASWLRAVASRLESRAIQIDREGAAA